MLVLLVALSVVVAMLWQRVSAQGERIAALEWSGRRDAASPWSMPAEVQAPPPAPPPPPPPPIERPATRAAELPRAEQPVGEWQPVAAEAPRPRAGFEEIFGRRLPIWAGGATLAVAGFLVVRYSIEAGLLSPVVRVMMGLVFGAALIGGAEAALRRAASVSDDRVRQALAGAGWATLYGSILAAANLYALVGSATAFVGLAGVTALAGALSIRFGAPSAVLGLVGGLAAPALVGSSQPDVPLLALYLALAVGGLCALGRQQRWWWLGAAALAGGLGWGTLLILGGALHLADTLAVGAYTLTLGVVLPLLVAGERAGVVRAAGALAGCAQLAALVAVGGFAPLNWALFGLVAAALVWLSRREPLLADAPILALGVAMLLMLAWPAPTGGELAAVLAGAAAILGVPAARRVWRDGARATDAPTVTMLALGIGLVPMIHDDETGLPALIGAIGAGIVAARGWRVAGRGDDVRFATLVLPAGVLLVVAGLWTLPAWQWAPLVALAALGLHAVAHAAWDRRVERGSYVFASIAGVLLMGDRGTERLAGLGAPGGATALLAWAIPAAAFATIALDRRTPVVAARAFQAGAVLLCYGAVAQVVPATWLPLVPAATRRGEAAPALLTAAVASVCWAVAPFAGWAMHALLAATGAFVAASGWPAPAEAALRIAAPAAALLAAAGRVPLATERRRALTIAGGIGGLIALHLAVTQAFAIDTPARFEMLALVQRFCWELLLAALAAAAWSRRLHRAAIVFGTAAFAHLAWFTGVVANPLIVEQDAGPWLTLSYALGTALLWAMPRVLPEQGAVRDRLAMALIAVASVTLLRQASHDPMVLVAGTDAGEHIARSLLALALAGGFLWTGIRRSLREWRIASLGLMLAAIAKVFLFDAAGLDGLARIASFAALGSSLIGVGWLYSRYLPAQDRSSLSVNDAGEGE